MTIKQWLRDVYYDDFGTQIWNTHKEGGSQLVAEVRGWGAIQNEFKTIEEAELFQDEVGKFIVEAIREKIARLPKQEISDEEIEKAAREYDNNVIYGPPLVHFEQGAFWYREQLKQPKKD
jgi:hypothetical protein